MASQSSEETQPPPPLPQPEEKKEKVAAKARWFIYTIHKFGDDWRAWCNQFFQLQDPVYLVAQLEKGEQTEKEHIQMVCNFKGPKAISNVIKMVKDVGHVERCWDPRASIAYCQKEETRVDGPLELGNKPMTPREAQDDFVQRCKDGEPWDSLVCLPIARQSFSWAKSVWELHKRKRMRVASDFTLSDFNVQPLDIDGDRRVKILVGSPRFGKTEFALAHFDNPYLVRDIDEMRHFMLTDYDGVVLDDIGFGEWTRAQWIKHTDLKQRDFKCRYFNAVLPATIPIIMTANVLPELCYEDGAVNRRLQILEISKPLWDEPDSDDDGTFRLTRH